jgi:hypothetical protein
MPCRLNHPAISDALSVGQRTLPALDASAIRPGSRSETRAGSAVRCGHLGPPRVRRSNALEQPVRCCGLPSPQIPGISSGGHLRHQDDDRSGTDAKVRARIRGEPPRGIEPRTYTLREPSVAARQGSMGASVQTSRLAMLWEHPCSGSSHTSDVMHLPVAGSHSYAPARCRPPSPRRLSTGCQVDRLSFFAANPSALPGAAAQALGWLRKQAPQDDVSSQDERRPPKRNQDSGVCHRRPRTPQVSLRRISERKVERADQFSQPRAAVHATPALGSVQGLSPQSP